MLLKCVSTLGKTICSMKFFHCSRQVLMKDIVTPVPQEEVRNVIKKCLENAALVNYTKVSELTKIEGNAN